MLWLIMTTGKCNLKCKYCGGSFDGKTVPYEEKYEVSDLKRLIENDPDPTVIFYGGEPLVNFRYIMDVMDKIEFARFGIQTNGILFKLLPERYWRRMNVVLFSIDGREHITDGMRGKGVYKRVLEASKYVKNLGIETIARMTVTEKTDIYEDVMHLIGEGSFEKVHWQLNVVWTEKWNFSEWGRLSYIPGIRRLMDYFMENLERGRILKIIPFLGVISLHYFPKLRGAACGAGYSSVTVSTDGRILSCPIAVNEDWSELGHINKGFRLIYDDYPEECKGCSYLKYCGGRCLYANKERYWGDEGWREIDQLTKEYLGIVLGKIGRINELISSNIIRMDDLKYDPMRDSTEIIP